MKKDEKEMKLQRNHRGHRGAENMTDTETRRCSLFPRVPVSPRLRVLFSLCVLCGFFVICLLLPFPLNAEAGEMAEEYYIKAAFLVNFAKLVQWPKETFSSPDDSLKICIIGEDRFGNALDVVSGKTANNRKLVIRKFPDGEAASECQIAFISASEKDNVNDILGRLGSRPVLTISDIRGFEKRGGIIGLFSKGNKVGFRINIEAARRAKLYISSHLLEVAEIAKNDNNE